MPHYHTFHPGRLGESIRAERGAAGRQAHKRTQRYRLEVARKYTQPGRRPRAGWKEAAAAARHRRSRRVPEWEEGCIIDLVWRAPYRWAPAGSSSSSPFFDSTGASDP